MGRIIKRGDIYYAELNPVVGSEQGGTRPVLIISNDTGNRYSPTVIIAAITGKTYTKAKLPTHTEVKDIEGLDRDSIILLEQIRTIDKKRLKQHMGIMPAEVMARVDKALAISIGIPRGIRLNYRKERRMAEQTQVEIKDKFCLTIDEASAYFNIGEKKLRRIVTDNIDTGFIIQNGVKFLIKRKQFETFLENLTAI